MATTTHTIRINENPRIRANTVSAKRVSKSRMYEACVVATVTEQAVADRALKLADHEARVVELKPALDAVLKANGYGSVEAFEAAHTAAVQAWYGPRHEARMKRSNERGAETGNRFYFLTDAEGAEVEAALEATGLVNPTAGVMNTLHQLVRTLRGHEQSIATHKKQNVQVGDQIVVTWCRTAALAHSALKTNHKWYGPRGFSLAVRTDIEIVSK
jgi:hypothetical protein